ncbi:MAG: HD domain-containing protein, partial [Proteobacteria bacterium]|nr:HD domain-containing protein [Pseudomonadota bacterium]
DYKEGQKDLIIKSLKAHIKSLKFTTDVFDKFSSIDDSSYDIFNLVVNLGVDELNADKVFFHIYSEEEASLVLVAKSSSGYENEDISKRFGKDISDRAKAYCIDSLKSDENPFLMSKFGENNHLDEPVNSFMVVPLKIRDKIFGVASAYIFQEGQSFSEKNVHQMDLILQKAASAIENIALYENTYENLFSTCRALMKTLAAKDLDTAEHSERVAKYANVIAETMGCTEEELDTVFFVGKLHDIGKIGIRDDILLKPERLTEKEYEKIKEHSVIGEEIIGEFGLWDREMEIIRHHHERFDGKGYPDGLIGLRIPMLSRILFVAECFDAMTLDTVYRKKMGKREAVTWIKNHSGSWFDPGVVDAFLKCEKTLHSLDFVET